MTVLVELVKPRHRILSVADHSASLRAIGLLCLIRGPQAIRTQGTALRTRPTPPKKHPTPMNPSAWNMGSVASGRHAAKTFRVKDCAAMAELA